MSKYAESEIKGKLGVMRGIGKGEKNLLGQVEKKGKGKKNNLLS